MNGWWYLQTMLEYRMALLYTGKYGSKRLHDMTISCDSLDEKILRGGRRRRWNVVLNREKLCKAMTSVQSRRIFPCAKYSKHRCSLFNDKRGAPLMMKDMIWRRSCNDILPSDAKKTSPCYCIKIMRIEWRNDDIAFVEIYCFSQWKRAFACLHNILLLVAFAGNSPYLHGCCHRDEVFMPR